MNDHIQEGLDTLSAFQTELGITSPSGSCHLSWNDFVPFYACVVKETHRKPFYFKLNFWFTKIDECLRKNDLESAFENLVQVVKQFNHFNQK